MKSNFLLYLSIALVLLLGGANLLCNERNNDAGELQQTSYTNQTEEGDISQVSFFKKYVAYINSGLDSQTSYVHQNEINSRAKKGFQQQISFCHQTNKTFQKVFFERSSQNFRRNQEKRYNLGIYIYQKKLLI